METYTIEGLTFFYPEMDKPALNNISLNIEQGQFITICGRSGCGKSTFLRHLKTVLTPHGVRRGKILFQDSLLDEVDQRDQSSKIGFVLQSPENQIVTDKVWHELAFGLESIGFDTPAIRLRVAEMASFFGIQSWFYKSVTELSGGQKQMLNLASIMAMQPSVLILDEPTSQLDPIAASDFLAILGKINRELGITVILTEHRLEDVIHFSDRMIFMENGSIVADDAPKNVGMQLQNHGNGMFLSMPTPMRIYYGVPNDLECPVTVREGRDWLDDFSSSHKIIMPETEREIQFIGRTAVELKEVWFKYDKDLPDVVKGLSLKIPAGKFTAIVGGNGTGKSTTLSLISGVNKPYRGKIYLDGIEIDRISNNEKFGGLLGVLPQNPQAFFVKKTVQEDLLEVLSGQKISKDEKNVKVSEISSICQIDMLLNKHPYDLSGGEQQRAALAKVLLMEPRILLLDEPTKGLDAEFKQIFADVLYNLLSKGVTIVMVSHDIEFCAQYADLCAMFFDGSVVTYGEPREFFSGNSFYTTSANRMARHIIPNAVTAEDVIKACGGVVENETRRPTKKQTSLYKEESQLIKNTEENSEDIEESVSHDYKPFSEYLMPVDKRRLSKRTKTAALMILIAIPLTIFIGIYYLGDRKYYFISMLIILETMLPFIMVFESRKPQARELIVISVLCALGVAGRMAFFMLPQFKPVAAIVIIAGVCFGGEAGFLVGAVTAFASNMFFGQGPWTPWQMFAFGIIGFLAGVLFKKGMLHQNRISLCVFGGLAVFLVYGGIMNPASVFMFQYKPAKEMFILAYLQGIPFDLVHAAGTSVFLWIISNSMIEKLERIKIKYGLIEQ